MASATDTAPLRAAAAAPSRRLPRRLVALAEPAMIILFGAMVGLVALSLLQAIYGVNPAALR